MLSGGKKFESLTKSVSTWRNTTKKIFGTQGFESKYKQRGSKKISNTLRMAAPEGSVTLQGGLVL